jgi:hypothetical protein
MAKLKSVAEWTRAERGAARSILLERSSVEVDGGELIGRDPRKISLEEFVKAGIEGTQAGGGGLDVIRARCLDCCCEQAEEVRKCVSVTCPSWPYRMGVNPFRKMNLSEDERAARSERMRIARERRRGEQNPIETIGANSSLPRPSHDHVPTPGGAFSG